MQRSRAEEPGNDLPAGPLYVPVRRGPAGFALRLCRTPLGSRTAVAFTSEQRLRSVMGAGQAWIRLSEPAVRALSAPLGATTVTVDPLLTARRVRDPEAVAVALC
ncbi:hypothetical protein G3I60_24880 [Streptomyces sp. SID13666]|uniref:SAV_915 family protein n=1 Tax=unclassified Streptomyces TaxID=2593676 RepID=UPI0013C07C1E|nr:MULTISPECIES: SAV_915 family protein [unclassified Streptomyces]NEA57293.1 hypothetical protein [Streptomyces sp. SID13666]NEA73347.1 hypothetical protein [Streptomyces sp. SID13588]